MFIAQIEPYIERIELFRSGQGVPNSEILREIANIYDEWIRDKAFKTPTCIGCVGEVKHMMNQLWGAIEREGNKPIKLEPKIPKLEPIAIITEVKEDKNGITIIAEKTKAFDNMVVESMKWGKFKTYCKEQGINVKGKTKEQLLKELGVS